MKNKILSILLLLVPIVNLFAQVPPPPDREEDSAGGPGAQGTPIDQYLIILMVFVGIFAIYYVSNRKRILAKN